MQGNGHTRTAAVLGFDIEPSHTPLYSVVALDENGNVVYKQEHVTIARLIRLVWELRPSILACDNIFELSQDERFLRKILSMLPDDVTVVQVTYTPDGRMLDLRSLAALAGIRVEGKLSPSKTAYLAALLALRGYGSRVVFKEEKTKIIIARARHGSAGGMSQLRYQRGIKTSILRATRAIKKLLDKHGFDYDLVFRKSGHGLESAVFIVYAPRKALYGILRGFNGRDIRVEIRPVYTGRIIFETRRGEEETTRRYLIVGVDPGIVTGVAGVDLDGRVVFVHSGKGLDRGEIINIIRRHGEPVLIATDVNPPPENVKKLASSLGVPLYTPPESLTVDEKQQLVSSVNDQLRGYRLNAHERDALAAALRALREYSSKFRQIESAIAKYPAEISSESIKAKVIQGKTVAEAVEEEIERILVEEAPKPIRSVRHAQQEQPQIHSDVKLEEYVRELEAARARIIKLEEELKACKESVRSLENEIRLVKMEAASKAEEKLNEYKHRLLMLHGEIEKLRLELQRKEEELNKLYSMMAAVARGDYIPVPKLNALTRSAVSRLQLKLGQGFRIVYVENPAPIDTLALDTLEKMGVLVLVAPREAAEQLQGSVSMPVHPVDREKVVNVNGVMVFLPRGVVEEAIEHAAIAKVERLINREVVANKQLSINELRRMLEEYRRARFLG